MYVLTGSPQIKLILLPLPPKFWSGPLFAAELILTVILLELLKILNLLKIKFKMQKKSKIILYILKADINY